MNKFFTIRKGNSMDEHCTFFIMETTDLLEEIIDLSLPKSIVCNYTINNLSKEYDS